MLPAETEIQGSFCNSVSFGAGTNPVFPVVPVPNHDGKLTVLHDVVPEKLHATSKAGLEKISEQFAFVRLYNAQS